MNKNCPYCGGLFIIEGCYPQRSNLQFYYEEGRIRFKDETPDSQMSLVSHVCPNCHKEIIWLHNLLTHYENTFPVNETEEYTLLFPFEETVNIAKEIPEKYRNYYIEAYRIRNISPMASAALSRKCLQEIIREKEGIVKKTLYEEIKELIKLNKLPQPLAMDLDAVRAVGNFAAHPIKDTNTGEIIDVEPGEAEWNVQIIFDLLNFYFIETVISTKRREMLNEKLRNAGKEEILKP